jgi:protein phosphatase
VQKNQNESLYSIFIKDLLQPKEGQAAKGVLEAFPIKKQQILDLIAEVQQVFSAQPILLKANFKPPVKIFGNIHGDYHDLMRFFDIWKAPCESGDIAGFDYLFLGNYVDRGSQSLEVLCLLLALKLKYPKQIFLLRGNHEDRKVNKYLGFGQECAKRLGENIEDPGSVF